MGYEGVWALGPGVEVLWTCCGGSRSGPLGLWGPGRPDVSPADFWHLLLQKVPNFFTKMHVDARSIHGSTFLREEVCSRKSMKLVHTEIELLPNTWSNLCPLKHRLEDYSYTIHVQFAPINSVGAYIGWNPSASIDRWHGFGDFNSINCTTNCPRTTNTSI